MKLQMLVGVLYVVLENLNFIPKAMGRMRESKGLTIQKIHAGCSVENTQNWRQKSEKGLLH